ncbi:hypothetical protein Scep_008954 [Stephania cephalantha]|uniref:Bet v I/Major latex protein domain-containing protein n=1 Tax=Stephania cephalantha TaxID=152367 RepID=A0AAP0JS96_9MAGN
MAVHTFTAEFESPIAPARLFNASVLHLHEIAHKVMPVLVKSGAIVEGDGGVGTIKEYLFTEVLPFKNVKERIEELDKEKFACKYSIVEGGTLGTKYKSFVNKVWFEPSGNGGSICKMEGEVESLESVQYTEEDKEESKEGSLATYKAVDEYLQANPDVFA